MHTGKVFLNSKLVETGNQLCVLCNFNFYAKEKPENSGNLAFKGDGISGTDLSDKFVFRMKSTSGIHQ